MITVHVAPHAHPWKPLFDGRFGGQNQILRALLEKYSTEFNQEIWVLCFSDKAGDSSLATGARLIEVPTSARKLESPEFFEDLQVVASQLERLISEQPKMKGPIEIFFHYWDGAQVFALLGEGTRAAVHTTYVSHSLQLSHLVHGKEVSPKPSQYVVQAERQAIENSDVVWVMSPYEAQLTSQSGWRKEVNINVVSEKLGLRKRIATPREHLLSEVSFICHGRASLRKNHMGFLKAFQRFADLSQPFDLSLLISKDFEKIIVDPRFKLRGLQFTDRTNYLEEMKRADVVVMPSIYEPLGLMALEAFAAGKVVVAPYLSGAASFLNDAGSFVADTSDQCSLSSAIARAAERAAGTVLTAPFDPDGAVDLVAELFAPNLIKL